MLVLRPRPSGQSDKEKPARDGEEARRPSSEKRRVEVHSKKTCDGGDAADYHGEERKRLHQIIRLLTGTGGEKVEAAEDQLASAFHFVNGAFEAARSASLEHHAPPGSNSICKNGGQANFAGARALIP